MFLQLDVDLIVFIESLTFRSDVTEQTGDFRLLKCRSAWLADLHRTYHVANKRPLLKVYRRIR